MLVAVSGDPLAEDVLAAQLGAARLNGHGNGMRRQVVGTLVAVIQAVSGS